MFNGTQILFQIKRSGRPPAKRVNLPDQPIDPARTRSI
jgi:hypothetical protein